MPKKKSKKIKDVQPADSEALIHPWRQCPYGQSYRIDHDVNSHLRESNPISGHDREGGRAHNPSRKDQLYPEEIKKIAAEHFGGLTAMAAG